MKLVKLQRAVHGKAAMANYMMTGYKFDVYVRHNQPATNKWGNLYISTYLKPNNNNPDDLAKESCSFMSYANFRNYREFITYIIENDLIYYICTDDDMTKLFVGVQGMSENLCREQGFIFTSLDDVFGYALRGIKNSQDSIITLRDIHNNKTN